MLTKLKRIVLTIAAVAALGAPALVPVTVHAQAAATGSSIANNLNCGADLNLTTDPTDAGCPVTDSSTSFNTLLKKIINIFSVVVGVIAVIMIIVGGLKYITSGGESSNVSGAKNTIIYAIVGLVIVALAQFIVHFVLANAAAGVSGT
jgi:cytochrome bd-type quinol oxidase subunit 2